MHLALSLLLAIQITSVTWVDAPPSMPKGTKIAVLEGDPKQPGIFTIRLKVPAGSKLAVHTHPRHERVTVLSGNVVVTMEGKETTFTGGAFYVNPPDVPHAVSFAEESVLQLTCEGPWEVKFITGPES